MLCGFKYYINKNLEENGPYTYYPVYNCGAFVTSDGLREIELPDTVTELRAGSLALPETVTDLYLSSDMIQVSSRLFGAPEEGVLELAIYVPEERYHAYLEEWSDFLDPVYGSGTAERLLKKIDGSIFYEKNAKYQKLSGDGGEYYRLLKVYGQDQRAFGVKEGTAEIDADAFSLCGSLEILYLPASLKRVEKNAFQGCESLQTVASDRAGLLDKNAFTGAAGDVKLYEKDSRFEGFLYDGSALYGKLASGGYTLIDVPSDYSGDMTLYKDTKTLEDEAFKSCEGLRNIVIPDQASLTAIGELYLPGQLKAAGKGLCHGCTSLETVQAEGITEIAEEMFFDCQSLMADSLSLGWKGVTSIGDRAFAYCSLMSSVPEMPELEKLGVQAFFSCQRLRRIVLSEKLASMGEECFGECGSLTQAALNGRLTGISRYCFYGCRGLVKLEFSEQQKKTLQVIGVQAFGQCSSLESLDLSDFPSLKQMGERTFEGCDFLTTVRLSENLERIPDYCFENCGNLSIVTLNSLKVTELGTRVFGDTLSPFIHIWVNEGSLKDYENAYTGILDVLYGEGTVQRILGMIDQKKEIIRGITFEVTDEGRVLKEASDAFEGSYTVPVDTVRIDTGAFMNCSGLTELVLPQDSRISLGDRCFKGCSALRSVELLGDIPEWGAETFMDCTSMERLIIGSGRGGVIDRIGTRAFKGCTGLAGRSSVSLRAALPVLGEECFADCTNLEAIPITATDSLEVIEDRAFMGCRSLSQFITSAMANIKSVGAYAFSECDSLSNPSVPAKVISIGEGCFAGCGNLLTVSFYCVLEEYPKDCFRDCPKLTRTGGVAGALSGLKRIGESAYEGCISLTTNASWNLGRYTGLEEIGENAFRGCASVTEVNLPATVRRTGAGAFDGLASVERFLFQSAQTPEIGRITLDTLPEYFDIRVPDSESNGDSIYKAYLAVFTEMFGDSRAYELVDSVSDGAKERNKMIQTPKGQCKIEETGMDEE